MCQQISDGTTQGGNIGSDGDTDVAEATFACGLRPFGVGGVGGSGSGSGLTGLAALTILTDAMVGAANFGTFEGGDGLRLRLTGCPSTG